MSTIVESQVSPKVSEEIFRAYDIRGVFNETLTSEGVYEIGQALGSEARALGEKTMVTARDGRLSSPMLAMALQQGILESGCEVIDIGAVPTPVLYYATHVLGTKSGVMLTGSHNPPEYNGLKMVLAGETLANEKITNLYQRIVNQDLQTGYATLTEKDILPDYLQAIVKDIHIHRKLKVVVDCGNGIASIVAPELIRQLGCEVIELFCDVDGSFPNHEPNPSDPKNLRALIASVKEHQADLGIVFDGDGDRIGVITNKGKIIWADRQMMLYSQDVLKQNPKAKIIFDVKCTRFLAEYIEKLGGEPIMWKTGHSLVKAKMKETNALLAGEMSGHIFFNDRWYGFDDAIYTAARLLEIVARDNRDIDTLFQSFPDSVNTPEINIAIPDARKFKFMKSFIKTFEDYGANISTIDGIRIDYQDGWALVRPSNTTPCLVLRFEAENENALNRIQAGIRQRLLEIDTTLSVPF